MEIVVKKDGSEIANGTLDVDTSVNPVTATFTPDGGTQTDCTGVAWSTSTGGAVRFSFRVSGAANGDFPLGPNGNPFTYSFTGVQNANGLPSGTADWPSGASPQGDDDVTWQGEATDAEPFKRSKGAT
ncbi:MAG TPA: hypothetical protein VMM84_17685 [Pyrinomonadaceae bacterium]|nr:hypothetical protein [Pyrinomonadaceae bacterium]